MNSNNDTWRLIRLEDCKETSEDDVLAPFFLNAARAKNEHLQALEEQRLAEKEEEVEKAQNAVIYFRNRLCSDMFEPNQKYIWDLLDKHLQDLQDQL